MAETKAERLWVAVKGWVRREPPPQPVHFDAPIASAVKDAEILLAYAAQSRRSLREDLITRLTGSREAVAQLLSEKSAIPADLQARFWFAYDELAVAMAPLSAHSIRSSLRINLTRFPTSLFTPPALLATVAIAVFFLCMVIQSFWVTGRELLDKADAIDTQRIELQRKLAGAEAARMYAQIKLRPIDAKLCDKGVRCQGAGASRKLSAEEQAELARLLAQADLLELESAERGAAIEELTREIAALNERGQPLTELLERWHTRITQICKASQYVTFLCLPSESGDKARIASAEAALASARDALATYRAALPSTPRPAAAVAYDSPEGVRLRTDMNRRLTDRAALDAAQSDAERSLARLRANQQRQTAHEVRIILGNLATYIVPLFMGLLGSLAFVLQTLTTQLREHTYAQLSASASVVRLCLGAIAGVFGGLATPAADGVLKGLPPLFIPFVFGYGIEILFSMLNRIVRTFTQGDNGQQSSP